MHKRIYRTHLHNKEKERGKGTGRTLVSVQARHSQNEVSPRYFPLALSLWGENAAGPENKQKINFR